MKPILEEEVEGLGTVYRTKVPFDQSLESLRKFGIENPISSRDLAYARIQKPISSLEWGSYTREGFLYRKNEPVLLALDSPLLNIKLARQAVKSNRNGDYFSTNKEIYEEYRNRSEEDKNKNPEERTVLILPKRENYEIPTSQLNEDELTRFLFKDQAESYRDFLQTKKINEIPVWLCDKIYIDNQEGSILTQLWLRSFDYESGLIGDDWDLSCDIRVHGVLEKIGEYTISQIKKL